MSGFTANDALEFQGTEDAEMIDWGTVTSICREHDADHLDFATETFPEKRPVMVDAGDLLAWLGY